MIRPLLFLALVGALLLAGCRLDTDRQEASEAPDPEDGSGAPADGRPPDAPEAEAPAPVSPRTSGPAEPASVLPGGDAGALAIATSEALYDDAPLALLAADDDLAAQARAASVGVRLGAPLLLVPASSTGPPDGAAPDELHRLGVTAVLTFDDESTRWAGELDDDLAVIPAPTDPAELAAVAGAPSATARTVASGDVTAAVAGLRRDGTMMLEVAAPADPDGSDRAAHERAPRAAAATEAGDDDPLARHEPAPPLDSVVVLASPDDAEIAATATARAAGVRVLVLDDPDPRADGGVIGALHEGAPERVLAFGDAFGEADQLRRRVEVAATGVELPGGGQVLFPGRRMVALYGHPGAPALGALGEQPLEDAIRRAEQLAADYEPLSDVPVVPTFEIIATIASASAGSDGSYSDVTPVEALRPWVDEAREAGFYVVLDLQPGRTDFLSQARHYEELLLEPHVGLALDPEWRLGPDQVHLQQIGSVDAEEVNEVIAWLADLTREHRLPQKLVVLHQFRLAMISNRDAVDTDRDELAVLLHADGHGTPSLKHETWDALTASPPPGVVWGWKNFYDQDNPMMGPEETLDVEPAPLFISYQ